MKKRILAAGAMLAVALGLAACSSAGTSNDTGSKAADTGSKTAEGENVFLIGSMGPLTGGAASYGNSVKNGLEIAIDEVNAAGGVKVGETTYTLKLSFKDDEAVEDKAVTAYNALMDEGINVLLGATTSGSSLAIADLTNKDGILQLTPSGSAKDITLNDNVFRLCFTDPLQGATIAKYVIDKPYSKVAVLYNNSDEYSTGVYEAFKEELEKAGKADALVAAESFTTEDIDFSTQLTKIKSASPDAIFIPAYYEAAAQITKQARAAGIEADFVGSDGWDGVLAQATDKEALDGAIFLSPFLASDSSESVQKFVKAYEKKAGSTPDQFAADAYDTVYVIKAAMEKAGSIESKDLISAMTEIKVSGLTGDVTFEASGEPSKSAKFVGIENGEYVQK